MNQVNLKNFGRGLFNEDFKIDEIMVMLVTEDIIDCLQIKRVLY